MSEKDKPSPEKDKPSPEKDKPSPEKDKPSPDVGRTIKKGPSVYQSADPQDLPTISQEPSTDESPQEPSTDTSDGSADDV